MADPLQILLTQSPLAAIDREIEARLKGLFPEKQFDHVVLPPRLTPAVWEQLTRRTPCIARGWAGITPSKGNARGFNGEADFAVWLVVRHDRPLDQLRGADAKPGLYGLTAMTVALLQGHTVPQVGSIQVTACEHTFAEGFNDERTAIVALSLKVAFNLYDTLDPGAIDDFLRLGVTWPEFGLQELQEVRSGAD